MLFVQGQLALSHKCQQLHYSEKSCAIFLADILRATILVHQPDIVRSTLHS